MDNLKLRFSLFFLLIAQLTYSQLSNFTLTVTKTNETCTANGTLNFSVSNTTPGSVIIYTIYRLPNTTTPISTQSSSNLSGLVAGVYRVIATQSIGNQNGTQQQDITINYSGVTLTYQLTSTNEICGNDGTITVNVNTGTAVNYEIIAGPMIRPLQTSNIFTGLTHGIYQIRVFDNCEEGVVQTYTLLQSNTNLIFTLVNPVFMSCTTVRIGANISTVIPTTNSPPGVIKYPLQVITTVFPPGGGASIVYNQTINSGNGFNQTITYYSQPYNYTFTITDGCGTVYNLNGTLQLAIPPSSYQVLPQGCTTKQVRFSNVTSVSLLTAPSSYPNPLPQNFSSDTNNTVTVPNLLAGTYVFNAINICGVQQTYSITIIITPFAPPSTTVYNVNCFTGSLLIFDILQLIMTSAPASYGVAMPYDYTSIINSQNYTGFANLPVGTYTFSYLDLCGQPGNLVIDILPAPQTPTATVLEGCQDGFGSVQITGSFSSITMTSAPSSYSTALPINLTSSLILGNSKLSLDMLPPGVYIFQSTDPCNNPFTTTVTIVGYSDSSSVVISPNCGSFNLNLNHTSTNTSNATFWLQKFNTTSNTWGHPQTGFQYTVGTVPTALNSVSLINNSMNYNLAFLGQFRVVKANTSYAANNSALVNCLKVINEFEFTGLPRITDVYSVSCGNTFEVIIIAEGLNPLQYRITTKNGLPFIVDNANLNIFSNLQPATYNFQVEDGCGNILNSPFEIINPNPLTITAENISCDGQNTSLTVPNFPFFIYQWWKGTNTTTILSTTNTLSFTPFNANLNNGTYHVRITYVGNPNSCLNQVLDYTFNINNVPPFAGQGGNYAYCGNQGTINLFTLLTGNYDANGVWTETTNSGTLNNNNWNSTTVPLGFYQFKYRVTGNCNLFDETVINITLRSHPQSPTASSDPVVCNNGNLNLYANLIPNATYYWTGPNGFTSNVRNPTISPANLSYTGIYTVHIVDQFNCVSQPSNVAITVSTNPAFTIDASCIENRYVMTATPIQSSYNPDAVAYSWTGPNNFSSSSSTCDLTGKPTGDYTLVITNTDGCSGTNSYNAALTLCSIPQGVSANNDGDNDTFNLTGFGGVKLKIFNRYGMVVYELNNYIDEWKGQDYKGNMLPSSTYYYLVTTPTGQTKTGWVYLMY